MVMRPLVGQLGVEVHRGLQLPVLEQSPHRLELTGPFLQVQVGRDVAEEMDMHFQPRLAIDHGLEFCTEIAGRAGRPVALLGEEGRSLNLGD